MTVAGKLAATFVKAAHEKRAEEEVLPRAFSSADMPGAFGTDDQGLREEFEESLREEETLREKARDYARLARERAISQPGPAATFFRRLLPIPYTGGEAAWRAPLLGAGAAGGYMLGERYGTRADPREVAKVLHGVKGKDSRTIPLLGDLDILRAVRATGKLGKKHTSGIERMLAGAPTETVASAASSTPLWFNSKARELVRNLEERGVSRSMLREAFRRAASESKEGPLLSSRLARYGGALGGLGAAGVLTGLPMAIRALDLRRSGGELAHKARKRMASAVEDAEREQFRRENVLRIVEGEPPLPLSEWRERRKRIRKDWESAVGGYRAMASERRKGQRLHGVAVPPAREGES